MKKTLLSLITITFSMSSGFVIAHEVHEHDTKVDKLNMIREIDIVTEKISEKVRFSPSVFIAKIGESIKLKIFNATDKDHGFSIDELNIKQTIQPGENIVEFKTDKAGLFKVYCQYHPAHLTGQILVVK